MFHAYLRLIKLYNSASSAFYFMLIELFVSGVLDIYKRNFLFKVSDTMSTQQPPARSWFRLASMAPRTGPAPAPSQTPQPDPVPQPRPDFIRPAFRTTSLPAQPEAPAPAPTPAPAPPSVVPAPVATAPMPLAFVTPVSATVAPAPAPATPRSSPTTAVVSVSPRSSPIIAVAPSLAPSPAPPPVAAPTPPPATPKLPATTTSSSVLMSPIIRTSPPLSLFPSFPAPKASPTPSVQQSPKPKVSSPFSPLQDSLLATKTVSPAPAPNQITTSGTIAAPATNSAYSPKPVNPHPNTPSLSPKIRPIVHPPSPLTLPPAQIKSENEGEFKIPLEIEQKTVLVQETKEKPKMSPRNSNNNHLPRIFSEPHNTRDPPNAEREVSKNGHSKNKGNKKSLDSVDFGVRVLTLAGENKGAIMELSPSMKKYEFDNHPQSLQKGGAYRTWGEGEKPASGSSSCNEEGNSKRKDKSLRGMAKPSTPMTAFLNNNVQGVNNSILNNVSCSHRDPGIHLSLSRKPNAGRGSGSQ